MSNRGDFGDAAPLLLGFVVFTVALWAQSGALAGVFYDDGIYLVLARSLASGEGYRHLNLPGTPHAVHYPPVYPFVMSVLWRVWPAFPANLALFRLADSIFLAAAAVIVSRHASRLGLPLPVRFPALLLGFVAFPLLAIVAVRFSEPLFLLLLAGTIATVDRRRLTVRGALIAGLLAGLATLTRSLGAAAILGAVGVLLWRRQFLNALAFGVASALVLAPWVAWLANYSNGIDPRLLSVYGSYGNLMGEIGPTSLLRGADLRVFGPAARLLLPSMPPILWWPLAGLLGVGTALGAIKLFPRSPVLVTVLAVYAGVVTVWPFAPDRFVWVILPWWFLILAAGMVRLYSLGNAGRAITVSILGVAIIGFFPREWASLKAHRFTSTADEISAPFALLLPAVTQELPATALLASGDESLVYLYTGRRAVPATLVSARAGGFVPLSAAETVEFYCDKGVTHIFDSGPGDLVRGVIDSIPSTGTATVTPVFEITDGPSLVKLECSS